MSGSILRANFIEETDKDIRIHQLEQELESARRNSDWWEEQVFELKFNGSEETRQDKVDEMHRMLYGDALFMAQDNATCFFEAIDNIYAVFKHHKWLIKLIRWLSGVYYKKKKD